MKRSAKPPKRSTTDIKSSDGQIVQEIGKKEIINVPLRRIITRKSIQSDLDEMARLVAVQQLTETEACYILGRKPNSWFNWKSKQRNKQRFDEAFARLRGAKIDSCLRLIDDCADGINMKQPDWRAAAWRAEKISPERFSHQPIQQLSGVASELVSQMAGALHRAYGVVIDIDAHPQLSLPAAPREVADISGGVYRDQTPVNIKPNADIQNEIYRDDKQKIQNVAKATIKIPKRRIVA